MTDPTSKEPDAPSLEARYAHLRDEYVKLTNLLGYISAEGLEPGSRSLSDIWRSTAGSIRLNHAIKVAEGHGIRTWQMPCSAPAGHLAQVVHLLHRWDAYRNQVCGVPDITTGLADAEQRLNSMLLCLSELGRVLRSRLDVWAGQAGAVCTLVGVGPTRLELVFGGVNGGEARIVWQRMEFQHHEKVTFSVQGGACNRADLNLEQMEQHFLTLLAGTPPPAEMHIAGRDFVLQYHEDALAPGVANAKLIGLTAEGCKAIGLPVREDVPPSYYLLQVTQAGFIWGSQLPTP